MNAPVKTIPKHFLDLSDHDSATLRAVIDDAKARKTARLGLPKGVPDKDAPLNGRVLAMIFDKQSTRTRISFDVGMRQLGGTTLMLTGNEMQLAREETIADTARVISRYVDAVMIRLMDHEMVEELAANPERLKELRQQCKTDRPKLGDVLCNRVAEATRKRFYGDGETPYTPPKEPPKF